MKNIVKERDHGHKREYRGAVEHWAGNIEH